MRDYLASLFRNNWHVFALAVCLTFYVGMIFGQEADSLPGPSTTDIKAWLANPLVLYVLMLIGSFISMVKQWSVAKMDGGTTTFGNYATHWQEIITTFFGNTVAFAALILSDNLSFVSALSIGYVISSASDLLPSGSRSTSLTNKE